MRARRASRQRGEIVFVALVVLLVSLLGLLMAMRGGMVETQMTGNNLARQKNTQVGDIALRQVENQILAAYQGAPLEATAANQVWYRDVAAGTAAPTPSYWGSCLGNASSALRCASLTPAVNGAALPYTVYAVVQPTGRYDTTSCAMGSAGQYTAEYYDIFLRIMESGGATAVHTETVYRLCTITS